jgi:hypothetical protein
MAKSESAKRRLETIRKKYGDDYFKKIAIESNIKWEMNGRKPRGFKARPDIARLAGKKSKRKKPSND